MPYLGVAMNVQVTFITNWPNKVTGKLNALTSVGRNHGGPWLKHGRLATTKNELVHKKCVIARDLICLINKHDGFKDKYKAFQ